MEATLIMMVVIGGDSDRGCGNCEESQSLHLTAPQAPFTL